VQLPGVGGGSQVACFLAYTAVFGVEKEAAAGASIVVWADYLCGMQPGGRSAADHEGFSLGKLRELAEHEKEAAIEAPPQQGDSAQ